MKVKNIMFSGFMAAVLAGACGAADAATVLASKEFVTTELGKKQNTLKFDTTPTAMSENPVTSGGVAAALEGKADKTSVGNVPTGYDSIVDYVDEKTKDIASDAQLGDLSDKVSANEAKLEGLTGTVAQEIAAAVGGKQDKLTFDDTPTENSANPVKSGGVYAALSGKANVADIPTVPTKVSAFENDANYVTSTVLDGKGYQTAGDVTTAIGNADIEMSQVTGLSAALGEKAAASDVDSLQTTVDGWTNETTGIAATYATKSELDGYATDGELAEVSDVADAAKATADLALPAATFTTFQQTVNAEAIAEAKKAGDDAAEALNTYKGEMTNALNGKVDDADLNNYYTKSEADTQFLEDAGLANGSAYLVTKNAEGKVVYSEVSVIDGNGDTVIGKAQ